MPHTRPPAAAPVSAREAALQAENDALRQMFALQQQASLAGNHSPIWQMCHDLLGVTDAQGVWLEVNPAWTAVLGWPAQRIVGRTSDWLAHPDDNAERKQLEVQRVAQGATSEGFEDRFRTSAGQYRLISWSAVPSNGFIYCVGRDITDERARETALRDSVDFARLALSAVSGVGVWTYDAASDRFFCDAGVSELYGIDPQEGAAGILRSGFLANVHPDDLAQLRATMAGGLLQPGDLELEYRICHPDGSVRTVLSRGHTYFDQQGVPVRRTGVGVDMTRQRVLEQQLRQAQKMEAVGQLTGGIAHDFNNMLQGVMGPLELLRARLGKGLDAHVARYIEMALGSTRRAATLTHRLLAFSRRQPLDPQLLDTNALVLSLVELLQRTTGETITLHLALRDTPCHTHCDANQLESALLNLAINARDAMPAGGTLTLRSDCVEIGQLDASRRAVAPGWFVRLSVCDTGMGMAPGVAGKAFDPFFTTKPLGQGTGLGLSMVYGFAGQSGGFASIDSVLDQGTTVSIYLPASVDTGVPGAPPQPVVQARDGAGATILVVEDEPAVLEMLRDLFGEAGYRVLVAVNGIEAQAHFDGGAQIDLLVTDVGLPGLNGRQVADAARLTLPHLPVLFMTGYAELAATTGGFLEPGMALIAKPFSIDAMFERVQQMLEPS
ncbi:hybrid sensor histidine kinase/response regulator [Massilia sp. S19_KUP03_FR1]|uniref:hybrid sensor histidine kinase/response regulator n=1 Tax=Massilia sp. S19_KUP03_FR1 TaxID=3025503 RepID=UPI002FCCDB3B